MDPVTTHFSSFEHQKENIQQIPQGRKASHLSALFKDMSQSDLSRSESLAKQQAIQYKTSKVENKIDPLEPFVTYIAWMESNYPQGHADIKLTVEKAARAFRKEDR